MIEEKEDPDQVTYQLVVVVEDVQLETLELIGRRLTTCELFKVKDKLSDFIHWDFYVREAVRAVLESENARS